MFANIWGCSETLRLPEGDGGSQIASNRGRLTIVHDDEIFLGGGEGVSDGLN